MPNHCQVYRTSGLCYYCIPASNEPIKNCDGFKPSDRDERKCIFKRFDMDYIEIGNIKSWPCDNSDMQHLRRKTNKLQAETEAQEKAEGECGI